MDSAMTTGLLCRLIQAGVGFDAALKMVNSALLVKSGEESLATIDVTQIDLYTGRPTSTRRGQPPSFVVKSGRTGYVESTSLPAGILRGVSFEKSTIGLREGDMVVMVSDGVTATGVDWIPSVIDQYRLPGWRKFAGSWCRLPSTAGWTGGKTTYPLPAFCWKRGFEDAVCHLLLGCP